VIQVDLPMAFGAGALLANAARRQLVAEKPSLYGRALSKVMAFHALTFLWPPLYLLVFYFGFETSHMWWHGDSVLDYPWLLPAFFIALWGANIGGFAFGASLVRQGRAAVTWWVWGAAVVFTVGWIVLQPDRTMTLGTYRDWQAGTAPWARTDPSFMYFVSFVMAFFTIALVYVYRSLWRDGESLS